MDDGFEEHEGPDIRVWVMAFCVAAALIFVSFKVLVGEHEPRSRVVVAKQTPATAVTKTPDRLLEEATASLQATKRVEREDYRKFNARITQAYNNWVAAERVRYGSNWQDKYVELHRKPKPDCSQFYGSFIHEDAVIFAARAACAAAQQAPSPQVPILADFLAKPD